MNKLAWWLIRAQFKARRAATALSMLAIALGVALGYAIHLINDAALADFSQAMKSVQGEPDAVIAPADSAGSLPLSLINELARDELVAVIAPVIETRVRIGDASPAVKLIGLDIFSAHAVMPKLMPRQSGRLVQGDIFDDGVYASSALLAKFKLHPGDRVTLGHGEELWTTRIGGDIPAARPDDLLLIADIAWVQERFGPTGGVTEGRLRLMPGTSIASWVSDRAERLPVGFVLRASADDSARVANVSRAYRVNLNVLALVALLTGAFLVFATQLTALAQRSTQFALLGVLGLSPRRRMLQVLLEGLAIGLPGSILGIFMGYGLALIFTHLMGGDLGGGFFSGSTPLILPTPQHALGFFGLGCLASLAGAIYPAYLNRIQLLAQGLKTGFAQSSPGEIPIRRRLLWMGKFTLLASATLGLTQLPSWLGLPLAGYGAIALVLALGIGITPFATQVIFGGLSRAGLPAPQRLAILNLAQAPLMAQVAASGLIVSFALTVSMVTMVSSFRVGVDKWLDVILPAPMYVRSKGVPLPHELLAALKQGDTPFEKVEQAAFGTLTLNPQRPAVALLVRELDRANPSARLPITGEVIDLPTDRIAVWISEPMQEIYQLTPGQSLRLPMLGREVDVIVGGVWRDYSRQFGAVAISAEDYVALGGKFEATDLVLWPRQEMDSTARSWLAQFAARYGLEFAESGEIRKLSLSIFDRSFAVTYALEAAAMLIGLFGLAVTLAASVWLRARELATLSALGFDRAMLARAVMFEGGLITCIGLLIGLICGIAVGAILTHVINPQAFHWRMQLVIPWTRVFLIALLTLLAGIFASRFAAQQVTRLPAAQVLASAQ